MQLGFVELFEPAVDPIFATHPKLGLHTSSEFVRQWAKHFSPSAGSASISVPQDWSPFFSAMLHNPGNFIWAKHFMESAAWDIFSIFSASAGPSRPFVLPQSCPTSKMSSCMAPAFSVSHLEDMVVTDEVIDTSSPV
jgi:hypothetical protein